MLFLGWSNNISCTSVFFDAVPLQFQCFNIWYCYDLQICPCWSADELIFSMNKQKFVQCFLQSDLVEGRPSTEQFRSKLPWFLAALPSADCSKGGHGAYTNSLDLAGTHLNYHLFYYTLNFRSNDADEWTCNTKICPNVANDGSGSTHIYLLCAVIYWCFFFAQIFPSVLVNPGNFLILEYIACYLALSQLSRIR